MKRTDRISTGKSYLAAFLGFAAAVLADQITKYLAEIFLKNGEPVVIIDGVFQLRYLENRGAAFGMMQNMQYVFIVGALIIVIVFAVLYGRIPHQKRYIPLKICGVLLCAGAVGNMIDCYVVCACIAFVLLILFYYKEEDDFYFLKGHGNDGNE